MIYKLHFCFMRSNATLAREREISGFKILKEYIVNAHYYPPQLVILITVEYIKWSDLNFIYARCKSRVRRTSVK